MTGPALVTDGLTSLIYGFIRIGEHAGRAMTLGSFALSLLLLVSFVRVERRRTQPLLPMRIVTDRLRGPAYLAMLLVPAVMHGVFFFVSQYLEGDLHFSAIKAGLTSLSLTGLIFTSSRITPRLVVRIGARPILLFGLVALAVATFWISKATPSEGYFGGLLGPLALFGIGAGATFFPVSVTILSGVPRADSGAASTMLQTMQQTGGAVGVAALSSIAIARARSDALLSGSGIVLVALVVAYVAIRPLHTAALRATEDADESIALAMVE